MKNRLLTFATFLVTIPIAISLILLIILPILLYWAAVILQLYEWFLIPLGMPDNISLIHMMGILLIVRLITYSGFSEREIEDEKEEKLMKVFAVEVFVPLCALAAGYVLKLLM